VSELIGNNKNSNNHNQFIILHLLHSDETYAAKGYASVSVRNNEGILQQGPEQVRQNCSVLPRSCRYYTIYCSPNPRPIHS